MSKAHTAQSAITCPEMTNVKQFKRKTNGLICVQNNVQKTNYSKQKQTTTTELQAARLFVPIRKIPCPI